MGNCRRGIPRAAPAPARPGLTEVRAAPSRADGGVPPPEPGQGWHALARPGAAEILGLGALGRERLGPDLAGAGGLAISSTSPRLQHPSPQKSMECTPSTSTGVASTSRFRRHPPFRRHPAPGLEYVLTCKDACPGPGLGMPKNRPVGPCPGQSSTTCTHAFDTPGPAEAQAFGDPLTRCNIGPRVRRGGDGGGAQV